MAGHALIGRAMDAPLFHGPAGAVDAATMLRAAHRVAGSLPAGAGPAGAAPVLNSCTDRLRFAVGFLAAVLSGRPCVLASDRSLAGRTALLIRFPGALSLTDPDATPLQEDRHGPVPANPVIDAAQVAAIVLTSGSTGVPGAHEKRWGALVQRSLAAAERFGWVPGTTLLATVPPQHMYGFETSVLLPLHADVASWHGPALLPADIRAAMAAVPGPVDLVTTPLHLRALLDAGGRLGARHARTISASAPLDPALAAVAEAAWHSPVEEIFGATEIGSIASRRTVQDETWLAYPGVAFVPTDDGTIVTAPYHAPVALADLVAVEGERIRVLGRRADLVKMAGKRTSLAALTLALGGLDGVEDAAFFAPDDLDQRSTARLVAFAVAPTRRPEDLLAELRHQIDPVFLPRRVVQVARLPRNEVGKLPRQALAALHAATVRV